MTPTEITCDRCGSKLNTTGLAGLCLRCLALDGLQENVTALTEDVIPPVGIETGRVIGDYEVIEEIARGGMGVVFRARQKTLDRIVALKMIRAGSLAHSAELARFRAEARVVASLQHPNIVAVHEVGEHEGHPFFSMEFVAGRTLDEIVRDQPLSPRRAAGYVQQIAAAIQHAHERGVLHRDLKPSNVLIAAEDRPRVTDFGLAKRLDGDPSLTITGQVLGSPNFMPPEQASGGHGPIGPASDVYSLGALLYHALTGRPPFVGDTITATLRLVVESEPASPRVLLPTVPLDLETICLKCLQKEPTHRYATAQALADDLGRFLRNEPITARPAAGWEKAWRWGRRKPALATALLLLLVVAIGSPIAALRINQARRHADESRANEAKLRLHAEQLTEQSRQRLYAARISVTAKALEDGDVLRARQLLNGLRPQPGEEDLRGFEWNYLWKRCHLEDLIFTGHTGRVLTVAYAPDGKTIASAGDDKVIRLWNPTNGVEQTQLRGHTDIISQVAFSPDGRLLGSVSADKTLRFWSMTNLGEARVVWQDTNSLRRIVFSPDGKLCAVGSGALDRGNAVGAMSRYVGRQTQTNRIALWNLVEGRIVTFLDTGRYGGQALAFDPKSGAVLFDKGTPRLTRENSALMVWSTNGLSALITSNEWRRLVSGGMWTAASYSPDSRRLAAMHYSSSWVNGELAIFDTQNNQVLPIFPDQPGPILCLDWSPSGGTIASGDANGLVRIWNVRNWRTVEKLSGHTAPVSAITHAPDASQLASSSWDGTVRIWKKSAQMGGKTRLNPQTCFSLAYSPDAQWLACGGAGVEICDATTTTVIQKLALPKMGDVNVAFSPNGEWLAACGSDGVIHLYQTNGWNYSGILASASNRVPALAFSPDSTLLAAAVRDKSVRVYDVSQRTELFRITDNPTFVQTLSFSPDGQTLVIGGNPIKLIDLASRTVRATIPEWAIRVAVSPDGTKLATVGDNHTISLFDFKTLALAYRVRGHTDEIFGMVYSPDSRTLATSGWDGVVKLWHVSSGEPLLTFHSIWRQVWSVAFSPDNTQMTFTAGTQVGGQLHQFLAPKERP
jgi:eukaryotic-like serine/threonine-protein kinase